MVIFDVQMQGIAKPAPPCVNMIAAIKAVRQVFKDHFGSAPGLKQCKDLCDEHRNFAHGKALTEYVLQVYGFSINVDSMRIASAMARLMDQALEDYLLTHEEIVIVRAYIRSLI